MTLSFKDLWNRLYIDMNVQTETCPVGTHDMQGKIKRKIRQIKESVAKSMHNERLNITVGESCS